MSQKGMWREGRKGAWKGGETKAGEKLTLAGLQLLCDGDSQGRDVLLTVAIWTVAYKARGVRKGEDERGEILALLSDTRLG